MFAMSPVIKPLATTLSVAFLMSAALPVASVQAHDRHNASKHFGAGTHINKKRHRKFHRKFGRGVQGQIAYQNLHAPRHHVRKRKKSNKGDLIAAGIIGLALGAIIASESARANEQPTYSYQDPYSGSSRYNQPIPLNEYDNNYSNGQRGYANDEPAVITYNDPSSYQPWTPEWRNWCFENYRSFNPSQGTYRGYDGLDHFCVPR